MQITQTMLDVCGEALYLLRQDVSLPTLANAPTDAGMEWVKCRKAFDYAAAEVLAAHDWRFARGGGSSASAMVDSWPQNVRKVLVYCLARELSVQIAGRTEDLKNYHQLYNRFLFEARLKDLEEDTSSDAVCKEVVATLRGYFSDESKDVPRSMVSIYDRIGAVRQSSFEEVRASHGWNDGATISGETALPPLAKAAFVALVCCKLAVACGLPPDAIGQLTEIYERKLARARIADLETHVPTSGMERTVFATIRPFFSEEQKNLPRSFADLAGRIAAVKDEALKEIRASHQWLGGTSISETNLPALAYEAWVTLIEVKVATSCGFSPEGVARLQATYEERLVRARVADLETTACSDAVTKEVLAAVRPFFSTEQKNLPFKMLDLYGRVDAVKAAAFNEVKAAHDWTNKSAITDGDKLPPIARAAWIVLMEIKLGTACGIPQDAIAQWQNVYLAKLNQARLVDLEAQTSTDAVASEVLAGIRPYFALDQKNLPLTMTSFANRIGAVRESAFREILAAHEWAGKDEIEDADDLPPTARAAWIALVQQKLCVACGLGTEAVTAFEGIWRAKLAEARVADLEASESTDPVTEEVLAAIRPLFSEDQKNLPRTMLALYGRIAAVKTAAFEEVRAAHEWTYKASITTPDKLPPIARAAWITLIEIKLGTACGIPQEVIVRWQDVYLQKLNQARVVDLEASKSSDAVVTEVMAAVRPFFSEDQKNLPRRMLDVYERVDAVKTAAFNEVKAAHDWANKAAITTPDKLPPIARAAWITLIEIKLGTACGIPQDAVARWQDVYLAKLNQARVVDLEGSKSSDAVVKEVVAAIRPFFALDQKNLPMKMIDLFERVDAVKAASFEEVKAAHDWKNAAAITDGSKLPPIARQAWIVLIEAKLATACGLPPEAVAKLEDVYLDKLTRARVAELEAQKLEDPVYNEVVAGLRPYFSSDQKNLPRTMLALYERVGSVQTAAFREILGAHEWTGKASITDGSKLPPVARAAWIALVQQKLCVACGLPAEAITAFEAIWRAKLVEARVIDLEASVAEDEVAEEVLAAVLPLFSEDQKNLPHTMLSLYGRVGAVKTAAFNEVKASHDWTGLSAITDGDKLPPLARAAWITLMESKLATACGLPPESVRQLTDAYERKLVRARVADLEANVPTGGIEATVFAAIRPFFSEEQKNLPRSFADLSERISAVKDEALKEVKAAHQWLGGTSVGESSLPALAYEAWLTLVEVKVATGCGFSPEGVARIQATYDERLVRARVVDLETTVCTDAVTKEVLAAIRPFFSLDQRNLPLKMLDLYDRVAAVKASAFEEVKAAHEWTGKEEMEDGDDLPPIARAAWIVLMEIKLGTACGIPQEAIAGWQGVYLQKLVQARVADLEMTEATDPVTREVLAGIRPTFAIDQKNVPMTMLALYDRIEDVKTAAFGEILASHNWHCRAAITAGETLPPVARAAWIALIQQKLCIACGLPSETAAAFENVWKAKLKEAKVIDLETTPVPEGLAGEVLTLVRDSFDVSETNLPMDLKTLADRIGRMRPIAMKEVLSAHPWAFAMEEWNVRSGRMENEGLGEYANVVDVPDDCIRIVGVFGRDGELVSWERVSDQIRASEAVCRVTYVRDVDELDEFSPDAYRLVVLRLAADLTRAMSLRTSLQNLHENIYRDALAEAKTRDTRQSNPGPAVVWGGNYYVDRMTGRRV